MKRRIKIQKDGESGFFAHYKRHFIHIAQELDRNWYIIVTDHTGSYGYDGYWRDSADKTKEEAFEQACRGAQIP